MYIYIVKTPTGPVIWDRTMPGFLLAEARRKRLVFKRG